VATAAELLLSLRPGLVPVPAAGQDGVCSICHSGCDSPWTQCYPCKEAVQVLEAVEILPIAMSIDAASSTATSAATRTTAATRHGLE